MSFLSDAWNWTKTAAGNVVSGAGTVLSAPFKASTYQAIGKGIGWTVDMAGKGLSAAGRGIKWAADNPEKIWTATKNFAEYAWNNKWQATKEAFQGLSNAVVGTVGMVCDAAVGGARMVANLGLDEKNQFKKREKYLAETWKEHCGEYIAGKIDPNDPNATYRRVIRYGYQGIGDVAVFIGVSAVTGGTGGALMTGARGAVQTIRGARILGVSAEAATALSRGQIFMKSVTAIPKAFGDGFMKGARFASPFTGTARLATENAAKATALVQKASTATAKAVASGKTIGTAADVTAQAARIDALATNFAHASDRTLKAAHALKEGGSMSSAVNMAKGTSKELLEDSIKAAKAADAVAAQTGVASKSARYLNKAEAAAVKAEGYVAKVERLGRDAWSVKRGQATLDFLGAGGSGGMYGYMDYAKGKAKMAEDVAIDDLETRAEEEMLAGFRRDLGLSGDAPIRQNGAPPLRAQFGASAPLPGTYTHFTTTSYSGSSFGAPGSITEQFWRNAIADKAQDHDRSYPGAGQQSAQQDAPVKPSYFNWSS